MYYVRDLAILESTMFLIHTFLMDFLNGKQGPFKIKNSNIILLAIKNNWM